MTENLLLHAYPRTKHWTEAKAVYLLASLLPVPQEFGLRFGYSPKIRLLGPTTEKWI
jgi:hypothetical protein